MICNLLVCKAACRQRNQLLLASRQTQIAMQRGRRECFGFSCKVAEQNRALRTAKIASARLSARAAFAISLGLASAGKNRGSLNAHFGGSQPLPAAPPGAGLAIPAKPSSCLARGASPQAPAPTKEAQECLSCCLSRNPSSFVLPAPQSLRRLSRHSGPAPAGPAETPYPPERILAFSRFSASLQFFAATSSTFCGARAIPFMAFPCSY